MTETIGQNFGNHEKAIEQFWKKDKKKKPETRPGPRHIFRSYAADQNDRGYYVS
jgi:hypothetical protein